MLIANQIPSGLAQVSELNLINQQYKWESFGAAKISQDDSVLNISVNTDFGDQLWSRAFLTTQFNSSANSSPKLNLEYSSNSVEGKISKYGATASLEKAKFQVEFRDESIDKILWSSVLNNTKGQTLNHIYPIPSSILNQPVEFRLYIMTNGPGQHILNVNKATITIRAPESNLTATVPEPESNLTATVPQSSRSGPLKVDITVKQNPISRGEMQTVTLSVSDPMTGAPIESIFVHLTIKDPLGRVVKDYIDNDGKLSPTFVIGENNAGTFTILGTASQAGVESSKLSSFEVR